MSKAITLLLATLLTTAGAVSGARAQDAAAGEKKAAMCIGCHGIAGYQATFPQIHKVPMISGQGAKYIVSALAAYKKGERKHPTMRAIAGSMSEQDMADLGAFYEKHGAASVKTAAAAAVPQPAANVAALLAKGACASCHGANYSTPIDGTYPKLAGQHGDYLAVALQAYATEGNPNVGRGNAIMVGQVKQFKTEELKAMAKYFGSLPGGLQTVPPSKFK